jgi:hypothetical protein
MIIGIRTSIRKRDRPAKDPRASTHANGKPNIEAIARAPNETSNESPSAERVEDLAMTSSVEDNGASNNRPKRGNTRKVAPTAAAADANPPRERLLFILGPTLRSDQPHPRR